MSPSAPYAESNAKRETKIVRKRPPKKGRLALPFLGRVTEDSPVEDEVDLHATTASLLTTPLHEAARLGSGELVRILLDPAMVADPNFRNATGRTALHCVAGGVTRQEEVHFNAPSSCSAHLSLRAPQQEEEELTAKNAFRSVGRLFRKSWTKEETVPPILVRPTTVADKHSLELDRMDASMALLTWRGGEGDDHGISINAVDDDGRTALHYSAEAGRTELCQTLLSRTETILTIIDQQGRTPCELAASAGQEELAANLEARALLYRDPYGMDDELLAQIMQNHAGDSSDSKPVAPFDWFKTYSMDQIQLERERRMKEAAELIQKIVERRAEGESALASILGEPVKQIEDEVDISVFNGTHDGHIEPLLKMHGWDVKKAVMAFCNSPSKAMANCGVTVPAKHPDRNQDTKEETCLICCETFPGTSTEWKFLDTCSHGFCRSCLGDYLTDGARSRTFGLSVKCPHHECKAPLSPLEVVQLSLSRTEYDHLRATSNNRFVVSNSLLRFCPHPNCPFVVKYSLPAFARLAGLDCDDILQRVGAVCTHQSSSRQKKGMSYEGVYDPHYFHHEVEPMRAHRFCFSCGDARAHWPLECDKLDSWKAEVAKYMLDVEGESMGDEDFNAIAQKIWMKANTRPCPKCQAPIEKAEGCNHMICSNPTCSHEFCWICRKDWRLHSTQTGGYFRCNRWQENTEEHEFYDTPPDPAEVRALTNEDLSNPTRMQVIYGTAMHESRVAHKKSREVDRFIHHYHRWSAHSQSRSLESKMRESVCKRLKPVVKASKEFTGDPSFNFGDKGLSFIHSAFTELDECRSVLLQSYPFAFYRYTPVDLRHRRYRHVRQLLIQEKRQFENLQSELEMLVEQMSDIVARTHLRANQSQIHFLTVTTADKRKDFANCLIALFAEEKRKLKTALSSSELEGESVTRITGLAGVAPLEGGSGSDPFAENLREAVQTSLENFRLRMESPELSEVDSDGFGDQMDTLLPPWSCLDCTFFNEDRDVPFCEMCGRVCPDEEN
jgi:ankyrin repeat protein